ncbi:lipopolysaccharide biosynthesis regulator YciM [Inhella inkyongensis]|uniref:Lipopolysaccharide assembly protein B n=1 Tax=Inhella inkyongensis TaxID=392593 RepID=A0A840S6M5_9BURK|nr:tetratricopeptide repeat protein [Inhella inkyongensis]MBB5204120.1 lipopolysaccharide biosynthesis regulator YciM [Inhella inkyongensis]
MDFDPLWLLVLPLVFGMGWLASRLDLRQAKRDPRDASKPYFQGLNFLLNEQQDKAIDAFIEAVQHDPDTAELHFALGNLFRRRGETERAVRVHQHLLQRGDLPALERARAQHALAQDFFKAGLFDRAEAAYRALRGTVFEPEADLALLSLYERSRDWAQAGPVAQALEERGMGSFAARRAHYLCEQALQARSEGQTPQALALLQQARQIAPGHPRAQMLMGQWALAQGDSQAALGHFEALLSTCPASFNLAAADYARAAQQAQGSAPIERAGKLLEARYSQDHALALVLALNQLQPDRQAERLSQHLKLQPGSLNAAKGLFSALDLAGAASAAQIQPTLERAAKPLMRHRCAACGFEAAHYFWQCPGCLSWDSFPPHPVEEL